MSFTVLQFYFHKGRKLEKSEQLSEYDDHFHNSWKVVTEKLSQLEVSLQASDSPEQNMILSLCIQFTECEPF